MAQQGEGDYLASVSDLMSGLLFVFIIVLMAFVLSYLQQEKRKVKEVERLTRTDASKQELLEHVQARLRNEGVQVEIDAKQGVLRLKEGILFESGSAELGSEGVAVVELLAEVFSVVLPCYCDETSGLERPSCPPGASLGTLDALMIEGHTDDRPLTQASRFLDNWELSTARARSVYLRLVQSQPSLDGLRNGEQQEILSVSGYADRRGVAPNDSDENRRMNRRIDLRFILSPPNVELVPPAIETARALEARQPS